MCVCLCVRILLCTVEVCMYFFFHLPVPAACVWPARARGKVLLISTKAMKDLQSFQLPTHSRLQNVDQINPAAAMFSLDNQLSLQVLKTDTLVSSPSQTWTVYSMLSGVIVTVNFQLPPTPPPKGYYTDSDINASRAFQTLVFLCNLGNWVLHLYLLPCLCS